MSTRVQPMPSARQVRATLLPAARSSRTLLPLLLLFGTAKLLLQIAVSELSLRAGYGIYRDELYYLVCGRRLAAGYVDQPPLAAFQARIADLLFGYQHLVAFRLVPNFAGVLMVMLTGLITQALGGSRRAAALAMLGVLSAPVYLATQSFLSMNAWDPVFWMAAVLALLRLLRGRTGTAWWLLLGVSTGLALENKSSAIFLIAALLLALMLTPARRLLWSRGFLLAAGVTTLLALPNLWWQVAHGFPTWEWLKDVQHSNKDVLLPPGPFLLAQVLMLSPFTVWLWLPGVAWLAAARPARPYRAAGLLYIVFLGIMLALHAKDYYLAPIYPLCFAAGAVFWTQWADAPLALAIPAHPSRRAWFRAGLLGTYASLMALSLLITAPFAVPIQAPTNFVRMGRVFHFAPMESEQHPPSPLPEFFADHLGWPQLVSEVSRVYNALPSAEKAQTGIIAGNYGEASALNILGRPLGLPITISGHQNYWLWGADRYTGKEMIVVGTMTPVEMQKVYRSCTVASRQLDRYNMPWEQRTIYLCHDRLQPFATTWSSVKLYF